jgi:hypothetical protein
MPMTGIETLFFEIWIAGVRVGETRDRASSETRAERGDGHAGRLVRWLPAPTAHLTDLVTPP